MPDPLITLADAVTDELNGPEFQLALSGPLPAERVYLPNFDLPDLKDGKLLVLATENEIDMLTRDADERELTVEIGLLKKVADTTPETLDPLRGIVNQVIEFLRRRRLAGFPFAAPIRVGNTPAYEMDLLLNSKQFASVVAVTYQILDEIE